MNHELLSKLDQWTASIKGRVAEVLADLNDEMLAAVAEVVRDDPMKFVDQSPPDKRQFLGLCAYLAIASELTRRHESEA